MMRKVFVWGAAAAALFGGAMWALMAYERSRTLRLQAEASLAAARATQASVETTALLVYVLVAVNVLWLAAVVAAAVWWVRRNTRHSSVRRWAPGPNARWRTLDDAPPVRPDLDRMLERMVQLRMLELLGAFSHGEGPTASRLAAPTAPPAMLVEDEDDDPELEWW